jgi:hypothetical protein
MSQVTFDQLKHFWMPSGVPCFIADRSDICDVVEEMGFQIYYLLGNDVKETKAPATTTTTATQNKTYGYGATTYTYNAPANPPAPIITKKTKLFKVVNNFVGRSISISEDALPDDFLSVKESCEYTMPAIPNIIVDKLDQFFRLVHSQHGTESIVILTYDMNATGPEGWGVLVPDQTNTAAHCKYDADSIAELKPENVMIVGSVHSHPEMSAYASGTDHADQADFDGLHITYGWQKSQNNGATQYHLELQMSGQNYTLRPEDVFENVVLLKEPDPDVVEWSGKVKKAYPPFSAGVPSPATTLPQSTLPAGGSSHRNHEKTTAVKDAVSELKLPNNAIIVGEIQLDAENKGSCPSCDFGIDIHDMNSHCCCVCDIPLISFTDSMEDICRKIHGYMVKRKIDITSPIYLWGYDDKDNRDFIIAITDEYEFYSAKYSNEYLDLGNSALQEVKPSHWDYWTDHGDDDDFWDLNSEGRTVCCGTPTNRAYTDCECVAMLFKEDLIDFDIAFRDIDIYDEYSNCYNCTFYHTTKCPSFKNLITEFVQERNEFVPENHKGRITDCSSFQFFRDDRDDSVVNESIEITATRSTLDDID